MKYVKEIVDNEAHLAFVLVLISGAVLLYITP